MKIRIKGGTYGWRNPKGYIRPIEKGGICEVSETEGARLCSLGIAESAEPYEPKPEAEPETEVKPEAGEGTEGEGENEDEPKVRLRRISEVPAPRESSPEKIPDRNALAKLTAASLRELCVYAGMDEEEAKKATKAVCIDFLTPAPEVPDISVGDIIL